MTDIEKEFGPKVENQLLCTHTHAEIVYDENPDQVVYRERDVLALIRMLRKSDAPCAPIGFMPGNNPG